jgi:hypothetical protein
MELEFLKKVAAVSCVAVVAGLLGHASSLSTASAATPDTERREDRDRAGIEGVWLSQVTITDCKGTTVRAFQALNMFQAGGTLTDTDSQPPTSHGPALGTWKRVGSNKYTSVFHLFLFNPNGSLSGSARVERAITLDADDDAFVSTIVTSFLDPSGVQRGSGCGTETAARLK